MQEGKQPLSSKSEKFDANTLRKSYIEFFEKKGHKHIPSASLIPENDPTVLFTTAGMHPLVPYLLGEKHPQGKRLVDWQKCIRTGDIDSVGDFSHLTFFEMLGNWSLGDYFKKESISFSYEFLTDILGLTTDLLHVTVFEGDQDAPRDLESAGQWKNLGIEESHIHFLPKEDNWWGPAGETGPCGPDTEIFVDTGVKACSDKCRPGCSCGKYFEVWNNVFMEFFKDNEGKFTKLKQQNVDTGMGIERTVAALTGKKTVYETAGFVPIIQAIEKLSNNKYGVDAEKDKAFRVIADHIRTSVFILGDERGIPPSNVGQGYVLRRLIRRAIRFGSSLNVEPPFLSELAKVVISLMSDIYPELKRRESFIFDELEKEEKKFQLTLQKGLKEFQKIIERLQSQNEKTLPGDVAFKLYDTYGFPIELTTELANEVGFSVDEKGFDEASEKHRDLSRSSSAATFKGGLIDHEAETTRLHTATHLLHKALRQVLGDHVEQRGSNITKDRLRFDFTHSAKVERDVLDKIESIVNEQIAKSLNVECEVMTLDQAREKGAMALFSEKYGENVKVYKIGDFSMEVCGGPHVENLSELGRFKITKEEASSAGIRRIKAVLVNE